MSRRADAILAARALRALRAAGVVRALPPRRLAAARRAGRALHATPAASIAIGAACDPGGLAIADERGRVTWGELDGRVRAIACALRENDGVGPDRVVAVLCRNHGGAIEAIAAGARAGADVLALNTEFAPPQIAAALGERQVGVVVCDEEFLPRLDAAGHDGPRIVAWHGSGLPPATPTLDALAGVGDTREDVLPTRRSRIVILTSGTTGTPKGASRDLPLRALLGSVVTLVEHLGLHRSRPVLVAPPLFHGLGLAFASIAHGLGAPVVLRRRSDPETILDAIAAEQVACLVAVPVMLQRILALDPSRRAAYDTRSLRRAVSAGAPLAPHVASRFMDLFGDILCNAYGSTETGFGALAGPADLRAAPGTVGRPPLGGRLVVLDGEHRPVPARTTGYVFVGGDLVFEGYTGGGTKETVGDGLMSTGDLGHLDAAGRASTDGREDDMIVSGGENVFPQEVEDALAEHERLNDVAVLGVPDDEFGQRLVAFVVPRPGHAPSTGELIEHLRGRVERYKLPRQIITLDAIPRTATGKVLRRELAQTGGSPSALPSP